MNQRHENKVLAALRRAGLYFLGWLLSIGRSKRGATRNYSWFLKKIEVKATKVFRRGRADDLRYPNLSCRQPTYTPPESTRARQVLENSIGIDHGRDLCSVGTGIHQKRNAALSFTNMRNTIHRQRTNFDRMVPICGRKNLNRIRHKHQESSSLLEFIPK